MASTIVGWAAFGGLVRMWQLGIEMRPIWSKQTAIGYPIFMTIAGGVGYYLKGVEERQDALLEERKQKLLEKRARYMAKKEATSEEAGIGHH
ncbi:hypothetical protein BZA77DRAFT_311455 [Pyronema omphalodes]|nr:hypothetical protein BZA77DRAFT_311455 [Pyronema omphalodes]